MFPKSKKKLSAIWISLLISLNVCATQIVEHADRGHQQANISANEQNRLAIEGRRIANVVPSQKGVLAFVKDESLGALYFTLANDSPQHGTVTVFVSDDKGVTYKLILVPRPIAGAEIILRPPKAHGSNMYREGTVKGRTYSYQGNIKNHMLLMADGSASDHHGIEVIAVDKEVPLWKEGQLRMVSKYKGDDFVGEKYHLTNVSPSPMRLVEQELYRPGVRAISIEFHTLAPGESTPIYILRDRNDRD
jgi:conjugal transfer pilus assembly protein TraK